MPSRTNTSSASKQNSDNSHGCYSWEKMDPMPRLIFTPGWAEVTPEQMLISVFFSSVSIQQLTLRGRGGGGREDTLQLHFAKCLFLDLNVHAKMHSATTVAMAATTSDFLFVIKYSHRIASNCKIRSNTAPKWSPSQLLDISYYRNQSLSTGAHSRKSCRFQFYIVINAAGEENFTTIAGVDCTNPDLFYPMTPPHCRWTCSPPLPHTQLPLLLVLKWFPQSPCWDGCCKGCSIFQWLH